MEKKFFATLINQRLQQLGIEKLAADYSNSGKINHIVIDDLLPAQIAEELFLNFPSENELYLLDAKQEKKYVGVNFNHHQKAVENCLYSFQDDSILEIFSHITGIEDLSGDPELYAGGISSMSNGCFLNPHIDNSHDRLRERYRCLNLLYYITPDWSPQNGGSLVLYPEGIKGEAIEIPSIFNRLVVMRTDNRSLHAVTKVTALSGYRTCISNYYFSKSSPLGTEYYHSTSFRGFPGEQAKDLYLRFNALARTTIKRFTGTFIGRVINTGQHRGGRKSILK